jgi:hypothetical protein
VEGGLWADMTGLNERMEVFIQAADEPQAAQDPVFGSGQESGDGASREAIVTREFFHESGLFPQRDGAAPCVEGQHERLGLFEIGGDDAHRRLCGALCLE